MDGSSNAARVKADPNLKLKTVKALDIEGSDKVNSDVSKWWLLLYSEHWKWWWRGCHIWSSSLRHTTHSYSSFLTNCLPCTIQNLDLSSVRVDFTPPCITRLWLSLTKRDVI